MKSIPCSIEAEELIIGSMLQSKTSISVAQSKIRSRDFYSDRNRMMYDAISTMAEKGIEVNAETVLRYVKENNLFDNIFQNDSEYLFRIIDSSPLPQNAKYYADIISEKSLLRDLIYASQEIQKTALEASSENTKDVVDNAEKLVFEITQRRLDHDFTSMKDLIYEAINLIEKRSQNKSTVTGVLSGFEMLDKITHGFQPSDLIILAARPSVGKTSFALNIVENIITNTQSQNYGIGFFSLEMSKIQIAERLISSKARINLSKIRAGNIEREDGQNLGRAFEVLSKAKIFIDDSSNPTIMEIRGKARQMKYRFLEISKMLGIDIDLKIIIVDYLQLVFPSSQKRASIREQEVAEISRGFKALAKELNIPIIALSQLSRAVENRQGEKPRLSDLRESGSIEQDADLVMFLHREKQNKEEEEVIDRNNQEVEIIISKHRNGAISDGIPLLFKASQTRFTSRDYNN